MRSSTCGGYLQQIFALVRDRLTQVAVRLDAASRLMQIRLMKFAFADFELDVERHELRRAGKLVKSDATVVRLLETTRMKTGNSVIYRRGAIRRVLRALENNQAVAVRIGEFKPAKGGRC